MDRELPTGLSDAQRAALSEFYAGHISAGQLSQRLGLQAPTSTGDSAQHRALVREVHPEVPRRGAITRVIEGLLSLTPRRTAT